MQIESIELLPHTIVDKEGNENYLRIKNRANGKKWCIRYIRKVDRNKDKPVYGWKYRTEIQVWNGTLKGASDKMLRRLIELGYVDK